jgi:sialate O-acetylesterase
MEWPLKQSENAKLAIQNAEDDQLRLFNFLGAARGGAGIYNQDLLEHLRPEKFGNGRWQRSNSDSAAGFSAVGYYFARRLREELDCPIGVINVSIGGTPIESWIPACEGKTDENWRYENWISDAATIQQE